MERRGPKIRRIHLVSLGTALFFNTRSSRPSRVTVLEHRRCDMHETTSQCAWASSHQRLEADCQIHVTCNCRKRGGNSENFTTSVPAERNCKQHVLPSGGLNSVLDGTARTLV